MSHAILFPACASCKYQGGDYGHWCYHSEAQRLGEGGTTQAIMRQFDHRPCGLSGRLFEPKEEKP